MTILLDFPTALEAAGVNVRVLLGWDHPHQRSYGPYDWREADAEPAGFMHHHTATRYYTPNRDKANGYAGLSKGGSDRLYQEDYGDDDYEPVYTIANAYPAPISSGAGDYSVLERVREGVEVVVRQGADTPNYYGNTHYYNVEWVLDGIGAYIDERVWNMMLIVSDVWNDMYGRNSNHHVGHYHHTRRKIDLYDGRDNNADETIQRLRAGMGAGMWANDWTDKSWMTFFDDTAIPGVSGNGRWYCSNDGTYEFNPPWGHGPVDNNGKQMDGGADYKAKINGINYVFSGLAIAVGN
jgi:hypothetical protein